jgi:glucose-1-phosphatase
MITAILFDLGNVLLNFNHELIAERFRPFSAAGQEERGSVRIRELAAGLERGDIDADAFIDECLAMMQAAGPMDRSAFLSMWNDIFWINEPLAALLPGLARRARLGLLSNTNPIHMDFLRARFPSLFAPFSVELLSYELRAVKPETRVYEEALRRVDAPADECLFFDDIRDHVVSAASLGIHAYQYVSVQGVRDILAAYDLLPDAPDQ